MYFAGGGKPSNDELPDALIAVIIVVSILVLLIIGIVSAYLVKKWKCSSYVNYNVRTREMKK